MMRTPDGSSQAQEFECANIGGTKILLPKPAAPPLTRYVADGPLLARCAAAWAAGLHFSLVGPPGMGKNELVYELARQSRTPLWVVQCHEELAPEDLAASARIGADGQVENVGASLMAAMHHGGICFADEIGKAPARSLSLLASVLDDRRTLTSTLTSITLKAHPDFRFCGTCNDADAIGLPAYINERLQPRFKVSAPSPGQLVEIVRSRLNLEDGEMVLLDAFREETARRAVPSPRLALTAVRLARQQWLGGVRRSRDEARRLIHEALEVVN